MGSSSEALSSRAPLSPPHNNHISNMAELGLKKKEVDALEFAFDVYDFKGDGQVDAFYAGDLMRACTSTPPSRPSRKLVAPARRARRSSARLTSSPCSRPARTPRTREASTTSLRS